MTREVTARFRVSRVSERENGKQVDLFPDLSDVDTFLCGTPTSAGQISITVPRQLAAEVFTQGARFAVTFTPEDERANERPVDPVMDGFWNNLMPATFEAVYQDRAPEAVYPDRAPFEEVTDDEITEEITRLTREWYELIGRDHHKDDDCHWYLTTVWSYDRPPRYVVEHHSYLLGRVTPIECASRADAEECLRDLLRSAIAGQRARQARDEIGEH